MRAHPSFQRQTRRLGVVLGLAALLVGATGVLAWGRDSGWLAMPAGMAEAPLWVGPWAAMLLALTGLVAWSRRSHELAVGQGMIPRWSNWVAQYGWLVPVVNLALPFAVLRARWRFLGLATGRLHPITATQLLLVLALVAAVTLPTPARPAAGAVAAAGCLGLRAVCRRIGAAQVDAELEERTELFE